MKPSTIIWANIPTTLFLAFTAYMIHIDRIGFGVASFIVAICCTTTFKSTKDEDKNM